MKMLKNLIQISQVYADIHALEKVEAWQDILADIKTSLVK
jgi:hypothetical protein